MQKRRNKQLAVAAFFFVSITALNGGAQTPAGATSPDNSKESAIYESLRTALRFENDGTATRETTGQIRIQSEAGVQAYGLLTFGFSSANEQIDIGYVRVRNADGGLTQ